MGLAQFILSMLALSTVAVNVALADGNVTVPIPDRLVGPMGTLIVEGIAGGGQQSTFLAHRCEIDSKGMPVKSSCIWSSKAFELGKKIQLHAGFYFILYSQTSVWVRIQSNQLTRLHLSKLRVPTASDGRKISFLVFLDMTDSSMQDKLMLRAWSSSGAAGQVCGKNDPSLKAACEAFNSDDYNRLAGTYFTFGTEGSISSIDHQYAGRDHVSRADAGQFISVFPGVYGIVFEDKDNDIYSTRYGVPVL